MVTADYGWLKAAGGANAVTLMGIAAALSAAGRWMHFRKPHAFLMPDAAEQVALDRTIRRPGRSPLIGICWRSGKSGGHRAVQYAPLEAWARVPARPAGRACLLCSMTRRPEEIAALEALSGRKIFVPPALDQKNELDRTAAMLSALDLLVSAPTAVSWLAAGVGVRAR